MDPIKKVLVRAEEKEDIQGIRQINLSAFEGPTEADLVDLLRDRGKLIVSLVAEREGLLVGHIAFSRVIIDAKPDLQGRACSHGRNSR